MPPVQIFVSYARIDNSTLSGSKKEQGFVTFLHAQLRGELLMLGQPQPKLWRDIHNVEPRDQFGPKIAKAVAESDLFLVILSRTWGNRDFCRAELDSFIKRWRAETDAQIKDRIVVVGKQYVRPAARPPFLQGQEGFNFFAFEDDEEDEGKEKEFFHRGEIRNSLYEERVKELADSLWRLARARRPDPPPPPPQLISRKIFLAKPATDMRDSYFRLVEELRHHRYSVVPDPAKQIPRDATAVTVIDEALNQAEGSIHLLGEKAGEAPEDLPPITELQLTRAAARMKSAKDAGGSFERLIWAPTLLNTETDPVEPAKKREPFTVLAKFDPAYRTGSPLLSTEKVHGGNLSEFVDFLFQHLTRPISAPAERQQSKNGSWAYVYHHPADADYAADLVKVLRQVRIAADLPALEGDEADRLRFHRSSVLECDAIVLCWAKAPEVWTRSTSREVNSLRRRGGNADFAYRCLVAGPPPGGRKSVFLELLPPNEIDVVVDLTERGTLSPEALEPLLNRVRPDRQ